MKLRKFWFGKYKNKEICGIIASHTGYILWLLENTQFKMTEFEQELYDAIAIAKVNGGCDYVYPKENLMKFVKNKDIDTPFYSDGDFFALKKGYMNIPIAKLYAERYANNPEYLIPYSKPQKGSMGSAMSAIHRIAFEDLDSEERNCFSDASSMSAFLY